MEHDKGWPGRIAHGVGKQIEHFRKARGMTVKELVEACGELGLPLDRSVVAKLEKGLRETIAVGEVLVLAVALGVPPVELIFPLGLQKETEALPGHFVDTWDAVRWFMGEHRLPGLKAEAEASSADWSASVLRMFQERDSHIVGVASQRLALKYAQMDAAESPDDRRAGLVVKMVQENLEMHRQKLAALEATMRGDGIILPEEPIQP